MNIVLERLSGSFRHHCHDCAVFLHAPSISYFSDERKIESGDVDLSPWTKTYPLAQGQAAFDQLLTDPGSTMKIVLT
jgi:hypothetical protein